MTEYDPLSMLTLDELKEMGDISGLALYHAEAKRIPPLTPQEQGTLLEEARHGSVAARNRVLMNCLSDTMRMAKYKLSERELRHSDLMDLIGVANVKMLEKFPKALEKEDPIQYLMTEVMYDMKHYMLYNDPMIQRSRQIKFDRSHPITSSGEAERYERLPAPDLRLVSEEATHYPELHTAIAQLTPIRRNALTRRFGLYDHPAESVGEIAKSEGRTYRSIDSAVFNGRRSLAKTLKSRR